MSKKVYVGLSGGVDSSISAALLKEQGYEVVGVYMKNWAQDLPGFLCPWREDLADAKRIAVQLDIPFKMFDFQTEYKMKVVDYMLEAYRQGITPNPDIMCNQEIKFRLFLDSALSDGADLIATGHYARILNNQLHTAVDESKDQTYFLYRMPYDSLKKVLFPLGELTKQQVRQMAHDRNLITATKKESMGICFVGKVGIKDFLSQFITTESGEVVDVQGRVLGHHDGAIFYTIGQRHGLNIGGGLPYYVVDKNMDTNQVVVSSNLDDEKLWRPSVELSSLHWLGGEPVEGQNYQLRTRHLAKLSSAVYYRGSKRASLELHQPIRAITPGQSAVLYDGSRVVGGGIISK